MFDLTKLPGYYIRTYGRERVAEILDQKIAVVAMWEKSGKFPLEAAQRLLEFDPAPLSEVKPLYEPMEPGKKVMILVPLSGPPEPKMMDSLMKLYDPAIMDYRRIAFNNLSVARNALAAELLRSPCEWAYWQDGDNVVPCGDAGWYKAAADLPNLPDVFAAIHTIRRLSSHKKTFVSVCYVGRQKNGPPQFGGGDTPKMRMEIRRGPRNELREVPWVGFGGVLTHRTVFEDIIKTQGDEIRMKPNGIGSRFRYDYAFFNPLDLETCGEDIPLCYRAGKAGHKIFLDLAIMAAHVGDRAFTFKDV